MGTRTVERWDLALENRLEAARMHSCISRALGVWEPAQRPTHTWSRVHYGMRGAYDHALGVCFKVGAKNDKT
jgi:hypothetical protein